MSELCDSCMKQPRMYFWEDEDGTLMGLCEDCHEAIDGEGSESIDPYGFNDSEWIEAGQDFK